MKIIHLLSAGLLLVSGSFALAHTDLKASSPKDGAMLNASPEQLELTFTEAVRLAKVDVSRNKGDAVDVGFKPSAEAAESFTVTLPTLKPGNYSANWTAVGADTHKIEGTINFMVHADGDMSHDTADMHGDGQSHHDEGAHHDNGDHHADDDHHH